MGKLPDNIVLVRMDKNIWDSWCKFCEEKGYLASKWAGFKLVEYMKNFGWKTLDGKRWVDESKDLNCEEKE